MENETKETGLIQSFKALEKNSQTKKEMYTNITDEKLIFNLENNVDFRLNECKGEKIKMKAVMFKKFTTPLDEPIVDSITGEVIKDSETKFVTIIIDDQNKSYVTGSKTFGFDMQKYVLTFGTDKMESEGVDIEICDKPIKNSPNKALSFKLV